MAGVGREKVAAKTLYRRWSLRRAGGFPVDLDRRGPFTPLCKRADGGTADSMTRKFKAASTRWSTIVNVPTETGNRNRRGPALPGFTVQDSVALLARRPMRVAAYDDERFAEPIAVEQCQVVNHH